MMMGILVVAPFGANGATAPPASTSSAFDTLTGESTSNDLPEESTGSSTSVTRTLRPTLGYPTLRLDNSSPRPAPRTDALPPPAAPSAQSMSDFGHMVQQTLGVPLPIFAVNLFQQSPENFSAIDQVNVPPDFVLGPGDDIVIRAWGSVDIDYRTTIDRSGSITIPKIGEVALAGVRYADLRAHLLGALHRSFHGFDLSVSLGQLHSIRIYVTGFARAPGTYTVNSLSTLINAVFTAGGPGPVGDLRRVELRRADKVIATIDLYSFLIDGSRVGDQRLLPEDVIYIPPVAALAAIAGSINSAAIFQLTDSDKLRDLIRYAGGLSTTASAQKVMMERVDAGNSRTVEEFPLDDAALDLSLRAGDLVVIEPISPRFDNSVTLRGHVAQAIRHSWKPGMRVSDLIPSTAALVEPGYWISHNAQTQAVDLLASPPKLSFRPDFPNINWEYAMIERIQPLSVSVDLIPIQLGKAVRDRDPQFDLELQPGDTLTIYSNADFRTPLAQNNRFVRVEGEVLRAGIYSMGPDESLSDLIAKAGGLTSNAYLFGAELTRLSVRAAQNTRLAAAIDRLEQDYDRHLIERSRNVLSGDLSTPIPTEGDAIHGLLAKLRELKPTGRIVMGLDPRLVTVSTLPLLAVEDGDSLYIPPNPHTVEVVGAVYQEGSSLYRKGLTMRDYIRSAALIQTADPKASYVVRPDGSVSTHRDDLELVPGDAIVVPERIDRESTVRALKDWTQILYQFGLGAAGLRILSGL
jgi:polysaccharide export outer membrane protein